MTNIFRRTSVACLIFLTTEFVAAQQKAVLLNSSLTEPARSVAYFGVDNLFLLKGEIPGKYIRIERSGGPMEMRNGMSMKSIVRYSEPGKDTFRVYADDKLIIEKVYNILPLGPYRVKLNGIRDTLALPEQILASKGLEVYMPDTYYRVRGKVSAYSLSIVQNGKIIRRFRSDSAGIPAEIIQSGEMLSKGTRLLFEKISVTIPGSSIRTLNSFQIQIK